MVRVYGLQDALNEAENFKDEVISKIKDALVELDEIQDFEDMDDILNKVEDIKDILNFAIEILE